MSNKSLLVSMELTTAAHAHNCRHNKAHRIHAGDKRLSIKVGRSRLNYCLECALRFGAKDLARLKSLVLEIERARSTGD